MNISLKNMDAVYAILKIEIEKNDYAEQLDKNLRKLRQKANMPGFRQGMVPFGLIKKLYGKQSLVEEINKLVSEHLFSYLRENQINILGEPMTCMTEQKRIDFDTDENFEFCFDLALTPVIDVQISKEDRLKLYKIVLKDEEVDKQIDLYRNDFGSYEKIDQVGTEDLVKGILVELEEGVPKTAGIKMEDASLMLYDLKGKMEQKKFIKAKVGDIIVFNPYKAYKGAEVELAAFLKIDKEAVKEMKSDFTFEISEINHFVPAEINQALFDKIFGENKVQSEAEFREEIGKLLTNEFASEAAYRRNKGFRDLVKRKADHLVFANDIIKRWILATNEKMTEETLADNFPKMIEDLKYRLVKEKLVKDFDILVADEDIEAMAKRMVQLQFAQYGMTSVPDETLDYHVKDMLSAKDTVDSLFARVLDEKLSDSLHEIITVEEQEVTVEEYRKIMEEQK